MTILQQILVGRGDRMVDDVERDISTHFGASLVQSNLWQISVPEECVSKTYDKLFKFLLDKNLVALGLYRLPGANDNRYSYVYTNPDPKTNITYRDRVFVLGKDIPKDLVLDYSAQNYMNDTKSSKPSQEGEVKNFYGLSRRAMPKP